MFGHQDEPQQPVTTSFAPPTDPAASPAADASFDASINALTAPSQPSEVVAPMNLPTPPLLDAQAPDGITSPSVPPTAPDFTSPTAADPALTPAAPATDTNALLDIKQQALQQLSPLVGHLDQSPEEKFRTTMMMIQAADNQDLIGAAYEAAQSITDEKARAQALLDIVNEINYFTQRQGK